VLARDGKAGKWLGWVSDGGTEVINPRLRDIKVNSLALTNHTHKSF
jgi:hypothetical protein